MSKKPLVSILLPVHNDQDYLRSCIESLLKQGYGNMEIIAIDDKSSDKSLKILKSLKQDKRLKVYANIKRYGISLTLNRALRRAKGQFITIMDAEDVYSPRKISKQVRFLLENPQFVAVGTQCYFINEETKKIGKSQFPQENHNIYASPLHGINMQFETILINKNNLPKDLLKFKSNSFPFLYTDLFMKILPYGKYGNLNEFLHYHRNHPDIYFIDLKKNLRSLMKLWFKSVTFYDYSPIVRSFFAPLVKSMNL